VAAGHRRFPLVDQREELKVVTGVDDHSRYYVIAAVVPRSTSSVDLDRGAGAGLPGGVHRVRAGAGKTGSTLARLILIMVSGQLIGVST
jgi:hypothetical protein